MATTTNRQAKRPVTKLAGPYGHPFHPALVALPIGAWLLSVAFDVASFFADDAELLVRMAFWCIVAGIAGALLAAVFGLLDLLAIPRGTKAFATAITHMILNLAVVALFAVGVLLRRPDLGTSPVGTVPFVLSLVAAALLGVSGWLGGELVFRYGVRVADEDVQAEAFAPRRP